MPNFVDLFAPLALLLPIPADSEPAPVEEPVKLAPKPEPVKEDGARPAAMPQHWQGIVPLSGAQPWYQVRIQQRVIVRVSPRRARQSLVATLPARPPTDYIERKIGNCLELKSVIAVQADAARLLLYTNDRKIISATLEKSCRPRDFYSGFYVEPSKDGKLCIKRDNLQSRNGMSCQMSRIRQLVPAGV